MTQSAQTKHSSPGRKVADSQVVMNELVLPNDANLSGNVLGGRVMHLADLCAGMAAMRHCRGMVATVAMDNLSFHHPIKVGEMMTLKASVNFTDRTSMEVGVRVEAENLRTGERRHTSSAYLTFVALDENGRPALAPQVIPETKVEQRRYRDAGKRRSERLARLGPKR